MAGGCSVAYIYIGRIITYYITILSGHIRHNSSIPSVSTSFALLVQCLIKMCYLYFLFQIGKHTTHMLRSNKIRFALSTMKKLCRDVLSRRGVGPNREKPFEAVANAEMMTFTDSQSS